MFYERNVQALLQADAEHAALVERLNVTAPTEAYRMYEAEDGFCTLEYQGIFLHDPHSPVGEVRAVLQQQASSGPDRLYLILGMGLGYLLDETFHTQTGPIVLYEPDLSFLRFILENVDMSSLLGSSRVRLVNTHAELLAYIRPKLYRQAQLDVLVLRGHAHLLAEEIPGLMARLSELEQDRLTDRRTGRAFHFQWLRQFLNNLPALAATDALENLVHRFSGKPALVISRGPSLDGALDAIREQATSSVLVAVGGALRRLYEANITPDIAVFYDANGMQEQLHGLPETFLQQVHFLVSPFTQACVFESPSAGKSLFLSRNNSPFADWLDTCLGRKSARIDGGGTVSIIGLQVALAMGCNPVILAGQDLAFPGEQVYAGGIKLQRDERNFMTLTPSETLYAQPESMTTTIGQNGETLPTLTAYTGFIRHLEEMARHNAQNPQQVQLYNASIGGAQIEGYPIRALHTLKEQFPAPWKTEGQSIINSGLDRRTIEDHRLALKKGLLDLKAQFQEARTLCRQLSQSFALAQEKAQTSLADIQAVNRQWNDYMAGHPFVAYWLMYEMMDFRESVQQFTSLEALNQGGRPALMKMLDACLEIMDQKALPWVEEAYQKLSLPETAQYTSTVANDAV